jgi:hypothetical protein
LKLILAASACFSLCACSVYESEGRKFLEQQGLQFAGVAAQANLLSCSHDAPTSAWVLLEKTEKAQAYARESETYDLRVVPATDSTYSCYYRFSSAQEMYEKTPDAIDLTIHRLSQGST